MSLPKSRKQESEADIVGLSLMSQACFNPSEAPDVWKRMSASEKTGLGSILSNLDFLSTHPASQKRMRALEKGVPQAMDIRNAHCGYTASEFNEFQKSAWSF